MSPNMGIISPEVSMMCTCLQSHNVSYRQSKPSMIFPLRKFLQEFPLFEAKDTDHKGTQNYTCRITTYVLQCASLIHMPTYVKIMSTSVMDS